MPYRAASYFEKLKQNILASFCNFSQQDEPQCWVQISHVLKWCLNLIFHTTKYTKQLIVPII